MVMKFFELEGAYLFMGLVVILITIYVATRPFMSKGALKKGLFWVFVVLFIFIGGHFWMTIHRMNKVRNAFLNGKSVICESRMIRTGAQSVEIQKKYGWRIDGDNFVSPHYVRPFHMARCIVK